MKARIPAVGLVVALALLGCGSPDTGSSGQPNEAAPGPASAPPTASVPDPTPSPTPTPTTSLLSAKRSWTVKMSSKDGYRLRATFELHDAIRDPTGAALTQAWEAVGGTGAVPCIGERHGSADADWDPQRTAFAFGTIALHNDTDGFTVPQWRYVLSNAFQNGDYTALGIGYSGGADCDSFTGVGRQIAAQFSAGSNDWGPVPVVFAFDGIFTPDNPTGKGRFLVPDEGLQVLVAEVKVTTFDGASKPVSGIKFALAKDQPS